MRSALTMFEQLRGEQWLLRRLLKHGIDALAGVTEPGEIKTRLRAAILDNGLAMILCSGKAGHNTNYAEAFERLYGEKLTLTPPDRKHGEETREDPAA